MERPAASAALLAVALLLACCGEGATPAPEAGTPPPTAAAATTTAPPTTTGSSTTTVTPTTAPTTTAAVETTTIPPTTTAPAPTGTGDATADRGVEIPEGIAPVVDGTLEPGEWAGSARTVLDDGTEVWWVHADGSLFVGIDGDEIGAVNLVLAAGDEVRMLHSSAALGSALYTRDGEAWRMEHGFVWCCRSRTDDTDARALLESEGWTANIGFVGAPGEVEFRVAWDGDETRAAISSIAADGAVAFWPEDLGEEAREALHGERQDLERFAADTWPRIAPSDR